MPPRTCSPSNVSPHCSGDTRIVPCRQFTSSRENCSLYWFALTFSRSRDRALSSASVAASLLSVTRSSDCNKGTCGRSEGDGEEGGIVVRVIERRGERRGERRVVQWMWSVVYSIIIIGSIGCIGCIDHSRSWRCSSDTSPPRAPLGKSSIDLPLHWSESSWP